MGIVLKWARITTIKVLDSIFTLPCLPCDDSALYIKYALLAQFASHAITVIISADFLE